MLPNRIVDGMRFEWSGLQEQPQKLDLLIAQTPTLGDPTSIPAAS